MPEDREYRIKFPVIVTTPAKTGAGDVIEENYALVTVSGKSAKDALLTFEDRLQKLVNDETVD